uniref:syntaxin-1A-like n=1 Tax=Myxine glutinosa TaxID=7769 RepID=UPI00358F73EA
MKDRLAELASEKEDEDAEADGISISITMEELFMPDFFKEVENVNATFEKMEENLKLMREKHSDILTTPQADNDRKAELDQLMDVVKKDATFVRTVLKAMDKRISHDEQSGENVSKQRIEKVQYTTLSQKFMDIMSNYNTMQCEYRERCKQRIQRQLEIAGKSRTDEEMENMLESNTSSVFTDGIQVNSGEIRQALSEIEARHTDIIRLESSIRELHDMFLDMASLVQSQGDMVNNIERSVLCSVDYVEQAKQETKHAVRMQSKARKKIILIGVGVTLILILIVVLAVTLS